VPKAGTWPKRQGSGMLGGVLGQRRKSGARVLGLAPKSLFCEGTGGSPTRVFLLPRRSENIMHSAIEGFSA